SLQCELVHNFSRELQCDFVRNNSGCHEDENYIHYSTFVYCAFGSGEVLPALLLLVLWITILFIGLGVTADDFLTPALILISNTLRLSQNIAGVTFLAFGNGAPDIISSLAGVESARPDLVIGELFGAGIFVTCAVVGSICLTQNFKITERPFLRDAIFYIGATYWAFCMFYKGRISLFHSIGFILLYLVYIVVVVVSSSIYRRHNRKPSEQDTQYNDQFPESSKGLSETDTGVNKFDQQNQVNCVFKDDGKPQADDPEMVGLVLRRSSFRDSYVHRHKRTLSDSRLRSNSRVFYTSRPATPNRSREGSICSQSHSRRSGLSREERLGRHRVMNHNNHQETRNRHGQQQQQHQLDHFHQSDYNLKNPMYTLTAPFADGQSKLNLSCNGQSARQVEKDPVDLKQVAGLDGEVLEKEEPLTNYDFGTKVAVDLPPLQEFLTQISPIDREDWRELNWFWRVIQIIKGPVYVILALTVPVVDENNHKNNWCRILNALHCVTAPLAVMFNLKVMDSNAGGVPIAAGVSAAGIALALTVWLTSSYDKPPTYHVAFGFAGFAVSVFWIYMLANEVVSLLKAVGIVLDLSDTFLGMTVLAWGNSVGDFISNLSVARQGFPRMAISACFGGPLLNLLLGFGLPYTWILLSDANTDLIVEYSVKIGLMYATLCQSIVSTMVIMLILGFHSWREFGAYLIVLYLVFFIFAVVLEISNI
ncbi:sodium/potassium/calcium exchanger 6-like, partial [Tropilaelaps mercedesae]